MNEIGVAYDFFNKLKIIYEDANIDLWYIYFYFFDYIIEIRPKDKFNKLKNRLIKKIKGFNSENISSNISGVVLAIFGTHKQQKIILDIEYAKKLSAKNIEQYVLQLVYNYILMQEHIYYDDNINLYSTNFEDMAYLITLNELDLVYDLLVESYNYDNDPEKKADNVLYKLYQTFPDWYIKRAGPNAEFHLLRNIERKDPYFMDSKDDKNYMLGLYDHNYYLLEEENLKLKNKIKILKEDKNKLKNEIIHLTYRPGGPGHTRVMSRHNSIPQK